MVSAMVACGSDSQDDPVPPVTPLLEKGIDTQPNWVSQVNIDSYESMTITMQVPEDFMGHTSSNDLLCVQTSDGAEIVAVAKPLEDTSMYLVYVSAPKNASKLIFKYYNDEVHHIYTSETSIDFVGEAMLGTWEQPYSIRFVR